MGKGTYWERFRRWLSSWIFPEIWRLYYKKCEESREGRR